jgi:hypothetical protein
MTTEPSKLWGTVGLLALGALALGLSGALSSSQVVYASTQGTDASILANRAATGAAVRGISPDVGVDGRGAIFGVTGTQTGSGLGYGGYFTSAGGAGVFGRSTAPSTGGNLLTPGVWGSSQHGVGVLGHAATGFGVYGNTPGSGTAGVGQVYGVYGATSAPSQGQGYGGFFESSTGAGVFGRSTALLTGNNLFAPGVWGFSQNGAAIYGQAGGVGSVAGLFVGNVVIDGNLTVTGSKGGYVVDLALNDGFEPLSRGDLVVVTGVGEPVFGNIPVPLVRKADSEASTAVIGVVDQAEGRSPELDDGLIHPGEYLRLVTLGAFVAVKVDAGFGAVEPGDLLVSSLTPGHAMRADRPETGTVVGKALSSLERGTGTVPILVALQ